MDIFNSHFEQQAPFLPFTIKHVYVIAIWAFHKESGQSLRVSPENPIDWKFLNVGWVSVYSIIKNQAIWSIVSRIFKQKLFCGRALLNTAYE